jgi:hypothetical protein
MYTSPFMKDNLLEKFRKLKDKDGYMKYVNEFVGVRNDLTNHKVVLKKEDILSKFLLGLKQRTRIQLSLHGVDQNNYTLERVIEMGARVEAAYSGNTHNNVEANYANADNKLKNTICHTCNKKGHLSKNCYSKTKSQKTEVKKTQPQMRQPQKSVTKPGTNPSKDRKCFECGDANHIKPNCPRLKNKSQMAYKKPIQSNAVTVISNYCVQVVEQESDS